jgi:hypothetical protein
MEAWPMSSWTTPLFAFEALLFLCASFVHRGILLGGYEHASAATAEGTIGLVLLLGLVAVHVRPRSARGIALGVQGFALLGTLVGVLMIAIGVGPQTRADHAFHLVLLVVLISGLAALFRSKRKPT